MTDKPTLLIESAKMTPPVTITGATLAGLNVADWVQYVTLAYVFILILCKVPEVIRTAYRMKHFKEWVAVKYRDDDQ